MYKIPLTNSPNQTFNVTVPVNGGNLDFIVNLNYNEIAQYWQMTLSDALTEKYIFVNLPLLSSKYSWANIINQLGYKQVGDILVTPIEDMEESMPNDTNLGTKFLLIWEDNVELVS